MRQTQTLSRMGDKNMAIARLVAELKANFETVDTISTEHARRLITILNDAPREALEIMVRERIKFCWMPARMRLVTEHGMSWEEVAQLS